MFIQIYLHRHSVRSTIWYDCICTYFPLLVCLFRYFSAVIERRNKVFDTILHASSLLTIVYCLTLI